MDVDICGLQYVEKSLEEIESNLHAQNSLINEQNTVLNKLVELIDYKIHLDFQTKTGHKLITPYDEPDYQVSSLEDVALIKETINHFLDKCCVFDPVYGITATSFNSCVQEYFRKKGRKSPTALEIETIMKDLQNERNFTFKDDNYKLYGGFTVRA